MINNFEKKIILLISSLLCVFAIILFPIYFFVFSGLNILEKDLFSLGFFVIIEFSLISFLFVFWKLYEKFFQIK